MMKNKKWVSAGMLTLGLTGLTGCLKDLDTPSLKAEQVAGQVEGDEGTTQLSILLTRSGELEKSSTIGYKTRSGTAVSGEDFEMADSSVHFAGGEDSKTITVNVIGDTVYEIDEKFYLDFSGSKDEGNIEINTQTIDLSIVNDDALPIAEFTQQTQVTSENNKDVTLNIKLSNPAETDIAISYEVTGTAARDSDYRIESDEKITIIAGEKEASIDLTILDDQIPEGGESVVIRLVSAENADIGELKKQVLVISGDAALNDTGYTAFSNETVFNLNQEPGTHPGQDASFGADSMSNEDFDGEDAFNLTKLDWNGNELSANASNWSCVRDNVTGLVWEAKDGENAYHPSIEDNEETEEDESAEHYVDHPNLWRGKDMRYYWHNEDEKTYGGSSGFEGFELKDDNPISVSCAFKPGVDEDGNILVARDYKLFCSTKVYIKEANKFALCGYKNWRLPTSAQLRGLADYQTSSESMLDTRYFPNAQPEEYFAIDANAEKDGSTHCFDFGTGRTELCHKGGSRHVRLVVTGE